MFKVLIFIIIVQFFSCTSVELKKTDENSIQVPLKTQIYFEKLGRILENKASKKLKLSYFVYGSNLIQARTLLGESVEVTAGMLYVIENEAQLAGVISHEIGHTILHSNDNENEELKNEINKNNLLNEIIIDWPYSDKIKSYFKSMWSKNRENQADIYAVNLLIQAGYNPYEYAKLLENIYKMEKVNKLKNLFNIDDTHENLKKRTLSVLTYLEKNKVKNTGKVGSENYAIGIIDFYLDDFIEESYEDVVLL